MKSFKILLLELYGHNSGKMKQSSDMRKITLNDGTTKFTQVKPAYITVFHGRYENEQGESHPLRTESGGKMYHRVYGLSYEGHHVFYLNTYGKKDDHGIHIGMTWKQRQKFHIMQGDHWIQKEENIRYIINILFLILGATLTIKSLFFGNSPQK